MNEFMKFKYDNNGYEIPDLTEEQLDEINKNLAASFEAARLKEEERLARLPSTDKSGNNVLPFEDVYDEWQEKTVKYKINQQSYLQYMVERFGNDNTEFIISYDETQAEEYSKLLLEYFSSDSVKWDALMWLKALLYTWSREMAEPEPTESLYESELGIKLDKYSFNNAKKRIKEQYQYKLLFQNYVPFFHYTLYGVKAEKENPYGRNLFEIKLNRFVELKGKYYGTLKGVFDKTKDEQKALCMKIVNEYCMEATYGFAVKAEIANFIADKIDDTTTLFSKDYSKVFKERTIEDIIKNDSFGAVVPKKFENLKPSYFKNNFTFLTGPERKKVLKALNNCAINEPFVSNEDITGDYDCKGSPNPGYTLMIILYAKSVCEKLNRELTARIDSKRFSNPKSESALCQGVNISDELISLIDDILSKFDFSLPGSRDFTDDEIILASGIKVCADEILKYNKIIEDYEKTGKSNNSLNNLTFPLETYALERFKNHVNNAYGMKERSTGVSKFNNAETRKFKQLLLELVDNCFMIQSFYSRNPLFPNMPGEVSNLMIDDNPSEIIYRKQKSMFRSYARSMDVLSVTRKQFFKRIADDKNGELVGRIIPAISIDLLSSLVSLLNDECESQKIDYKGYITNIYNVEVFEHIDNNLQNIKLNEKVNLLSEIVQDEIARM